VHMADMLRLALAAGVFVAMLWVLGSLGRSLLRAAVWATLGLTVYVALDVSALPRTWAVTVNPFTVGTAALLGVPGIALSVLAHALFAPH